MPPKSTQKTTAPDHLIYAQKIQETITTLRTTLGSLTIPSQIIAGSTFLDSASPTTETGRFNLSAWNTYTGSPHEIEIKNLDYERFWTEIDIYRSVGDPLATILTVPKEGKLNGSLKLVTDIAHRWVYLMANNALGGLEDNEFSRRLKNPSTGDSLRAFLHNYRCEKGFRHWTVQHALEARMEISTVWKRFQETRRTSAGKFGDGISKALSSLEIGESSSSVPLAHPDEYEILTSGSEDDPFDILQECLDGKDNKRVENFFDKLSAWEVARDAVSKARVECDAANADAHEIFRLWRVRGRTALAGIFYVDDVVKLHAAELEDRSADCREAMAKVEAAEDEEAAAREEYEEAKIGYNTGTIG